MHDIWVHLFVPSLPILEKIVRPIIVYFFLVLVFRLSGKRELVQLNPFDLVVLLTISNTVQNAIIGDDNSLAGGMSGPVHPGTRWHAVVYRQKAGRGRKAASGTAE